MASLANNVRHTINNGIEQLGNALVGADRELTGGLIALSVVSGMMFVRNVQNNPIKALCWAAASAVSAAAAFSIIKPNFFFRYNYDAIYRTPANRDGVEGCNVELFRCKAFQLCKFVHSTWVSKPCEKIDSACR